MIPDFQSIMLPFLRILSDGKEHTNMTAGIITKHAAT